MKLRNRTLIALSLIANAALAGFAVHQHRASTDELHDVVEQAIRGDELHLGVHARSLAALEGHDDASREETIRLLRALVEAGEANAEARALFRESR